MNAPSPAGEGWGEECKIKCLDSDPIAVLFTSTAIQPGAKRAHLASACSAAIGVRVLLGGALSTRCSSIITR